MFEETRKKFKILQLIDDYVVSGGLKDEEGIPCPPKPDIKIFNLFLKRFDLKAQDCLFIDDSEKNVIAAKGLGMTALVFKDAKHLSRRF